MTTYVSPNMVDPAAAGFSFRNKLINGDMRIDTRNSGASAAVTSTTAYCVDRFIAGMSGANGTAQRVASSVSGFPYQVNLVGTTSTTTAWFGQRIEAANCAELVGQSVTVSFYAACTNLTGLGVRLAYANTSNSFGNGGTVTTIASSNVTINSTMTRYTVTFTSLPANTVNGLYLEFVPSGNLATGTFSITGVQLEKGTAATPFENRLAGLEETLCQRYYEESGSGDGSVIVSGYNAGAAGIYTPYQFKVTKRATPTVAVVGTWGVSNTSQPASYQPGINGCYLSATITSTGSGYTYNNVAGNKVTISAEL